MARLKHSIENRQQGGSSEVRVSAHVALRMSFRGVRSKLKLGGGGSGFQGQFFIKKGHLQVNSFTVAIQSNCL